MRGGCVEKLQKAKVFHQIADAEHAHNLACPCHGKLVAPSARHVLQNHVRACIRRDGVHRACGLHHLTDGRVIPKTPVHPADGRRIDHAQKLIALHDGQKGMALGQHDLRNHVRKARLGARGDGAGSHDACHGPPAKMPTQVGVEPDRLGRAHQEDSDQHQP